ncbi:MAG: hypothetical protein QOE58_2496 [Actinomycetota bacterium]|jgi:hypothetical protein|nr:hypothetical protein [Actinomycetota bacterium]
MKMVKKIVLWSLVIFFIYAIIKAPTQAANIIQSAWNLIVLAAQSIANFFNAILKRN